MPFCCCLGIMKGLWLIGFIRLLPRNERSALYPKFDMTKRRQESTGILV